MPRDIGSDENIPFKSPLVFPILIGLFLFLFLGGILLIAFVIDTSEYDPYQNSKSYSAVGHHALAEILRGSGFQVFRTYNFFYLRSSNKTFAFLEPDAYKWNDYIHTPLKNSIYKILIFRNNVVLACPKWEVDGINLKNPQWIDSCGLLGLTNVNKFLDDLGLNLKIKRKTEGLNQVKTNWRDGKTYNIKTGTLQFFTNLEGADILVKTIYNEPIVCVVPRASGKFIIISDPDIFNNMFIGEADNGVLMLSLLQYLVPQKTIWIDEICHGFGKPPSILRALLTYPALCITLQAILVGLCLVWLIGIRFRPPIPLPERNRSVEEQIKAFANVTCSGGQHNYFLQKYIKSAIQDMSEYYPSIIPLPFARKLDYLEELGKACNNPYSIKMIYSKGLKAKNPRHVIMITKGIYKWKERMTSYRKSTS